MHVLSWNLFHGRAVPPAGRPLLHEFAAALAGWSWDVALLQEVPPWWPPLLASACDADHRSVLTSRNALLPVRRAVAIRRPDLAKSGGGGANAILVRGPLRIEGHAWSRLRAWPERRVVHAVRLGGSAGGWVGNLHGEAPSDRATAGSADATRAFAAMSRWATGHEAPVPATLGLGLAPGPGAHAPLVLGGDFNLRPGPMDRALPPGWARVASRDVDHVVVLGARADGPQSLPDRALPGSGGTLLSDHPPLRIGLVAEHPHRREGPVHAD